MKINKSSENLKNLIRQHFELKVYLNLHFHYRVLSCVLYSHYALKSLFVYLLFLDHLDWQEIVKLIDDICLMNSEELKALSKRAKSAFDKEINIQGLANKYNNALIDLFEG